MLTVSTRTTHDPFAGIVAPVILIWVSDAAALITAPAQVDDAFGTKATASPLGSGSTKRAAVSGTALGFVTVIVNVEGTPVATGEGLNAFAIVAGLRTCKVAVTSGG